MYLTQIACFILFLADATQFCHRFNVGGAQYITEFPASYMSFNLGATICPVYKWPQTSLLMHHRLTVKLLRSLKPPLSSTASAGLRPARQLPRSCADLRRNLLLGSLRKHCSVSVKHSSISDQTLFISTV